MERKLLDTTNAIPTMTVEAAAQDGRPCPMDVFITKLFDDCDDRWDCCEAIDYWLHGDWDAALGYLEPETISDLRALADKGGQHE